MRRAAVFFTLAIELLLLFAVFGVGWLIVLAPARLGLSGKDDPRFQTERRRRQPEDHRHRDPGGRDAGADVDPVPHGSESAGAGLGRRRVDGRLDRGRHGRADAPSIWYWPGPLLVGLLGYIWASFNPQKLSIGQSAGYFAGSGASAATGFCHAGIAGAMLGYWFGRAWTSETEG